MNNTPALEPVFEAPQVPEKRSLKSIFPFLVMIVVVIGTVVGLVLVRQRQLLNQHASEPSTPPQCQQIKAFDANWNELSGANLGALKAGDKIRLTAVGNGPKNQYKAAKFTINGTEEPSTALTSPSGDFYFEYTVSPGITTFNINAKLQSMVDNNWY